MNAAEAGDRPGRLKVGVIGAGRVGAVLGAALTRAGHRVVAATGVSAESVTRAERLLPGVPLLPADEVTRRADLVLATVPDDALRALVEGLAETGAVRPGQLFAHTSGAYGIEILEPATRRGALPLALHPAMTFAGRAEDLDRLAGVSFGVTAPDELRPVAEVLVLECGGEPEWIAEPDRPLYHAALAHGANHLVTLVSEAMDLLSAAGADDPAGTLRPLLEAALDNALAHGDAALTGPIVRGDVKTVIAHVEDIRANRPDTLPSYVAMARATLDRAVTDGRVLPIRAASIAGVLDAAITRTDHAADH
jgi:predicted short-subunit dehydrogenase-like oxidoreductase (DUF2520 family)